MGALRCAAASLLLPLLLCWPSSLLAQDSSRKPTPDEEIMDCYNTGAGFGPTPDLDAWRTTGHFSRLVMHKVLWPKKKTNTPLTVTTVAQVQDLPSVELLCRTYSGGSPVVVALYIPLWQPGASDGGELTEANMDVIDNVTATADVMFKWAIEKSYSVCELRFLILWEVFTDEGMYNNLPYNALRNAALLAARTPMVLSVDPNTVLSKSVMQVVKDTNRSKALAIACKKHKVAWVLAPFHLNLPQIVAPGAMNSPAVAEQLNIAYGNKAEKLLPSIEKKKAIPADLRCKPCWSAINYSRWVTTDDNYLIKYELMFEPYSIMDRTTSPMYDVRFLGHGFERMTHAALANATAFKFVVLSQAYLPHVPFPSGAQRSKWFTKKSEYYRHNQKTWHDILGELGRNVSGFVPNNGPQFDNCRNSLTWWQDWWWGDS